MHVLRVPLFTQSRGKQRRALPPRTKRCGAHLVAVVLGGARLDDAARRPGTAGGNGCIGVVERLALLGGQRHPV